MFFKKKNKIKWLSRPVWDCNALRGLTYTGNVLDWHSLYSLNCLMPLKFCNQNKSFEKNLKGRVFLKVFNISLSVHT